MELIGKGYKADGKGGNANKGIVWVARRIPDGYVSAHANQARITTFPKNDPENCLYAPDVVSFAREMGYYDGPDADFSFCDAYAPLDFGALRACDISVTAFVGAGRIELPGISVLLLLCFPQPDNKSAGSRKTASIFFIVFLLFINICTPIFFSTIMGNSITSGRYMQLLPSFFHIFTKAFLKIFVFFHSAARLFPVFLSFLAGSMPYWN